MSVIELIRLLTGHSQSHAKEVHIRIDGVDVGRLSDFWSEDEENFYLEVKDE